MDWKASYSRDNKKTKLLFTQRQYVREHETWRIEKHVNGYYTKIPIENGVSEGKVLLFR